MSTAWRIRAAYIEHHSPRDWKVRRIGDLVDLANGYPFPSDSFGPTGEMPLVRIRELVTNVEEFSTYVSGYVPRECILEDGDIVVGMDGDFNAVRWVRGKAALNQRLCRLRPRAGVDIRFIGYALPSILGIINDLTFSTTVKHLSSSDILAERLPLPPIDEQRRIADFLDAEIARIDRLASLRSRQLTQLDIRERAWHAHLFEQGKSGVRMRVKHLLRAKPRYGVLVPEFVDNGVPFIRVNNISGLKNLDGLPRIPEALSKQYARTITRLGDVLLSVVGSMGKATIVTEPLIGANVARAVAVLRLNPIHAPSLFTAWIGTSEFEQQAQLATGTDSAQPTLGMEDLASFSLRWPTDSSEEKDMARAVEENQLEMETTRIILNRQLSLLAERRQALITAAVTGGITV